MTTMVLLVLGLLLGLLLLTVVVVWLLDAVGFRTYADPDDVFGTAALWARVLFVVLPGKLWQWLWKR